MKKPLIVAVGFVVAFTIDPIAFLITGLMFVYLTEEWAFSGLLPKLREVETAMGTGFIVSCWTCQGRGEVYKGNKTTECLRCGGAKQAHRQCGHSEIHAGGCGEDARVKTTYLGFFTIYRCLEHS
jgi:hypothetical protein